MDVDVLCVACNWSNDFWQWIGAGAAGAAAAAAWELGGDQTRRSYDEMWGDYEPRDEDGGDVTPPDQRHYQAGGRARYTDGNNNPYWPGVSPYPNDGIVYHHGTAYPVDAAGEPVGGLADVASAQTTSSRG